MNLAILAGGMSDGAKYTGGGWHSGGGSPVAVFVIIGVALFVLIWIASKRT